MPKTEKPSLPRRMLDSMKRAARHAWTGVSATIALALLVGLVVATPRMQAQAAGLTAQPLRASFNWPLIPRPEGSTEPPKTWLDAASRDALESIVTRVVSPLPGEHASLVRAQEALMATGWFSEPVRVVRLANGVIRVRADWRVPVAVVRWDARDRLVAAGGELLLPDYEADRSGLKVVSGAQYDPPALGEPWLGGDVQAGLALLEFLRRSPANAQVSSVDVSEFTSKKTLWIVTDRGTRIHWGAHPHEFAAGQAPADVKRRRLEQLLADTGRIDAGVSKVDLRLWGTVYEQRDITQQEPAKDDAGTKKKPRASGRS
jgi:hypothetical protein